MYFPYVDDCVKLIYIFSFKNELKIIVNFGIYIPTEHCFDSNCNSDSEKYLFVPNNDNKLPTSLIEPKEIANFDSK